MKKKPLLVLTFLLVLYIGPLILAPSSMSLTIPDGPNTRGEFTLSTVVDWTRRQNVSITGSVGATTNYQVPITVTYDTDMQADFDDIRFWDDTELIELDYWRENYTASTTALFWVEVQDDLDSNVDIGMYYGNAVVSTTSDGHNTFQEFYDKDSTTGWNTANGLTVTTSTDFLRFYNPTASNAGSAQRYDLTLSADFQMMAQMKTVDLGAVDQAQIILADGSVPDRFTGNMIPLIADQTDWYYYDGSWNSGGDWAEGTEYIFTIQVDEGDSSNGIDYRNYDISRSLLDSALTKSFAAGTPTDCDGLYIGDGSGAANMDGYFRWIAFRKCIDTEPFVFGFGDEESWEWNLINSARLIFPIGWDPTFQFGYDAFFIFLGLIMIPASTMYMVRGGRKEFSTEKLFYGLILFCVGFALLVGGIMP